MAWLPFPAEDSLAAPGSAGPPRGTTCITCTGLQRPTPHEGPFLAAPAGGHKGPSKHCPHAAQLVSPEPRVRLDSAPLASGSNTGFHQQQHHNGLCSAGQGAGVTSVIATRLLTLHNRKQWFEEEQSSKITQPERDRAVLPEPCWGQGLRVQRVQGQC